MNQRARIVMTEDEITAFIAESRKLQLGTVNPDGTPHLVTMFYGLSGGRISFWTYGKAQKALNIQRDARVSCLIEAGDEYSDLRGVLVYGVARRIDDSEGILEVGMNVARRMAGMPDAEELLTEYVAHTGRKRVAFVVEPTRVISWDHRKLTIPV
ncbi:MULTISPECIES: pyridoxamine 5'-phosphate oxidase family protein [Streptosporangium]|uniref:Nitroimidazol reductase NimA-like FMN-containing flavoprotein (Pyridoxamine 5'-phosphate oxidase superfamily) n=1 Tax=Streptosporangium brasiliense TaxID=47480 RepID=A0ABT9R852_9ACTN|nr:pyridoxamine 5'-phosphate oxidase family protein [Streptosporangium brasiliense]MDP9865328.1 nitroimidazol reductase NimA-like FMN-containing flavoprotein (pyridoxamine 5'-phosphate oxidase superfamily) [Streptosporangium brasiliense]